MTKQDAVAAAGGQEPVAELKLGSDQRGLKWWDWHVRKWDFPVGTKLYAHPAPQAPPVDAQVLGSALVLALQGDYSEIDELARSVKITFRPDGRPRVVSPQAPPPDLVHPRSRETAAESLSVDTSVAEPARFALELVRAQHYDMVACNCWICTLARKAGIGAYSERMELARKLPHATFTGNENHAAIDAAMSADVRDFVPPVSSPDQTLSAPSAVAQWRAIESEKPPAEVGAVLIYGPLKDDPGFPGHNMLVSNPHYVRNGNAAKVGYTHWCPLPEPPKDVRSQAKETP